jgi:hypothetical protein
LQANCYDSDPLGIFGTRCSNDVTTQAGCEAEALARGFTPGKPGTAFASIRYSTKGCYFYGDMTDNSCEAYFGLGGNTQSRLTDPIIAG